MMVIAVIAAGAMGAKVGRKIVDAGNIVLTNLDGRSDATHRRAHEAGMGWFMPLGPRRQI